MDKYLDILISEILLFKKKIVVNSLLFKTFNSQFMNVLKLSLPWSKMLKFLWQLSTKIKNIFGLCLEDVNFRNGWSWIKSGYLTWSNHTDKSWHWHWPIPGVLVVKALVPHEATEDAGIGSQASNTNTQVIVHADNFLLMGGQFRWSSLQRNENNMGLGLDTNCGWALFDGLHGVLDLVDSALWGPDTNVTVILIAKLIEKGNIIILPLVVS